MGYKQIWVPEQQYIAPTPYIPGTPGNPGVPPTPSQVIQDYNIGWNSGATSIQFISENGYFKFKAPTNIVGIVTGLNDINTGVSYLEIDFSFYLSHGTYQVYENGVSKTSSLPYTNDTTFEVRRIFGVVSYLVDGVVVYESLNSSNGVVFADISMYMAGDSLSYAEIVTIYSVSSSTIGSGVLEVPNTVYSESNGYSTTYSSPQIDGVYSVSSSSNGYSITNTNAKRNTTVSASINGNATTYSSPFEYKPTTVNLTMQPIDGYGSNKPYTTSNLTMQPIDGYAETSPLTPSFSIVDAFIPYFTISSEIKVGEVATVNLTMQPIDGNSSDHNITVANINLEPIYITSGNSIPITNYTLLKQPKSNTVSNGIIQINANALLKQPKTIITSNATIEGSTTNNGDALLKQPKTNILSTQEINISIIKQPKSKLVSSVEVSNIIKVNIKQPKSKLISNSSNINSSIVNIKQPKSKLISSDGYIFIGKTVSKSKLISSVVTGSNSSITLKQPKSKLISSVEKINTGSFISSRSKLISSVNNSSIILKQPKSKLISSVELQINKVYKQYVFNLTHSSSDNPNERINNEMTIYTNFNFKKIIKLNNEYYGLADDGLYLIDGNTDNGNKINYSFETHKTDFDNNNFKTISSVYLEGKINSKIKYTLIKGEDGENSYEYYNERGYNAMNTRIKLGKGVKSIYYGFKIEDSSDDLSNDKIVIDNIHLEVDTLNRRI